MNIYFVLSELLHDYHDPAGDRCICQLVVARTHSQARYLAWKTDKIEFSHYLEDMPKFTVRKLNKALLPPEDGLPRITIDNDLVARVVTDDPAFSDWWLVTDELQIRGPQ